jgi:hypothetical protein
LLYILFTADLPREIPSHTDKGIFADDLALITWHASEEQATIYMNDALYKVHTWFCKWRLKLNAAKSQVIRFSNRHNPPQHDVKLARDKIDFHKQVRYLGVLFDERLTFKAHVTDVLQRADRRIVALKSLCRRRFSIGAKAGLIVLKAYIRPLLTFGCPAWIGTEPTRLKKLEARQNKALRIVFRKPPWFKSEDLRELAAIEPLTEIIFETACSWLERSINAKNLAGVEAKTEMRQLERRTFGNGKRPPLSAIILHLEGTFTQD